MDNYFRTAIKWTMVVAVVVVAAEKESQDNFRSSTVAAWQTEGCLPKPNLRVSKQKKLVAHDDDAVHIVGPVWNCSRPSKN